MIASSAPQAGLASIAQPGTAPKGMPARGMQQIMDTARKMSDAQLADILAGRSMDVPQYVAMTEAMGRKSLRTAMQGAQAQAQMQQPSVKDKLLMDSVQEQMPQMQQPVMAAEGGLMDGGGIATLPASNMESMDMASGGIVAFDQGGEIPSFKEGGNWFTDWRDSLYSDEEKAIEAAKRGRKTDAKLPDLTEQQLERVRVGKPPGLVEVPMPSKAMEDEVYQSNLRQFNQERAAKEQADIAAAQASLQTKPAPAKVAPAPAQNAPAAPTSSWLDDYKSLASQANKDNADYLAKLEGRGDKAREGLAKLKSQGLGEALMQLSSGLLSRPTMAQGLGAGLPLVAATSAASRKEQKEVERLADDMDLNLAKARTAAKQGDRDAQLKFMELANMDKYRMGALKNDQAATGIAAARLAQLPESVRAAQYFAKNPDEFQYSSPAIGKRENISMDVAAKQWLEAQSDIARKRALEAQGIYSAQDLYNSLNRGSIQSATIPGQGANVIGKI